MVAQRPMGILLVDDNDDDILLMKEALARTRRVDALHVAREGDEALAFLRGDRRPELVLLAIHLRGRDGFDVLAEIKSDKNLRSLPVVLLTTSGREEDIVRAYEAGACSYVSKPVSIDRLQEMAEHFALYWTLVARVPRT